MQKNEASSNVINQIKTTLSSWFSKLNLSVANIIEIISCFFIGFFIGFLIKKYCIYFFVSLASFILITTILNNFEIITIDWIKIRAYTGIGPSDTIGMLSKSYLEWVKNNLLLVIGTIIGFLIGCKVGQD